MVGKVGIDGLLKFLFHVVHFFIYVGIDMVFKFLVAGVGHGEGETHEEVGNKGV
jgi:hypothetical protein